MREQDNLKAIVSAYRSGRLHDEFDTPQAMELHNNEKILIETYCPSKDVEILNIGCGTGRETFALYNMGYHNVKGIDCTEVLLETARKRAMDYGLNIQFEVAFAHNIPFDDRYFDVVTLFRNVYGHITPHSARLRSLTEIRRVLKRDGLVIMNGTSIYNEWHCFAFIKAQEFLSLFYNPFGLERGDKILRGGLRNRRCGNAPVPRSHWFRPGEVEEDARKVGFSVTLATTNNGLLCDPRSNSTKVHRQGPLVYVLRRIN